MAENPSPAHIAFGLARIIGWTVGLIWLARSVFRPHPQSRLHWYDRLIRGIGLVLLTAFLLFAIPRWLGWIQ